VCNLAVYVVGDVVPYPSLILSLGSHKKRDNRCAIAAPKLEAGMSFCAIWYSASVLSRYTAFAQSLTSRSWGIDHHIDEGVAHDQSPLEDFKGTPEERAAEIKSRRMQAAAGTLGHEKKALIVFNSHIGQHKFAGNVIVGLPSTYMSAQFDIDITDLHPNGEWGLVWQSVLARGRLDRREHHYWREGTTASSAWWCESAANRWR
jgi:hypothetical protein